MRLVAAFLLTLCGAAAGHSFAAARKRRVEQLSELVQALGRLEVKMLEKLLPLKEALIAAAHEPFKAIGASMTGARSALGAYLNQIDQLRARGGGFSSLEEEDMRALERLFEGLGMSGASEQRLLIGSVRGELERLSLAARKKAEEQAKLYTSLGLIAGLALAICLI